MNNPVLKSVLRPVLRPPLTLSKGVPVGYARVTALDTNGYRQTITALDASGRRIAVTARKV